MGRVKFLDNKQGYKRQNTNIIVRVDWLLLLLITILAVVSVIMIRSAMTSGQYGTDFSVRQIIFYVSGFFMVFVLTFIHVKWMKQYVWIIYGAGVLSLMILFFEPVLTVTPIINGEKSWYQIAILRIQPSEIVLIIYILTQSYVI